METWAGYIIIASILLNKYTRYLAVNFFEIKKEKKERLTKKFLFH